MPSDSDPVATSSSPDPSVPSVGFIPHSGDARNEEDKRNQWDNSPCHSEDDGSMWFIRAAHYVAWAAEFIHGPQGIWPWILSHGDWVSLVWCCCRKSCVSLISY